MKNKESARQLNFESESSDAGRFPDDLFESRDVVVLGETSHGKHSETLLNFLDKFGHLLNQIFIELPVDFQDSVDKYIASGEVDGELENLFMGAEDEGKNVRDLTKVLDKVREIGKGVICFDSSKTGGGEYQKASLVEREKYFLRGESRDEDMFINFQRHYTQTPGKYLLIVGAVHAKEGRYPEGDKRLGERLKEAFGERCISFEMTPKVD